MSSNRHRHRSSYTAAAAGLSAVAVAGLIVATRRLRHRYSFRASEVFPGVAARVLA